MAVYSTLNMKTFLVLLFYIWLSFKIITHIFNVYVFLAPLRTTCAVKTTLFIAKAELHKNPPVDLKKISGRMVLNRTQARKSWWIAKAVEQIDSSVTPEKILMSMLDPQWKEIDRRVKESWYTLFIWRLETAAVLEMKTNCSRTGRENHCIFIHLKNCFGSEKKSRKRFP